MSDGDVLAMPLHPVSLTTPDTDPPQPRCTRLEVTVEALKAVPNLIKLCLRLLGDPRVPRRTKRLLGFAGLYVLSPIDLIPELFLPVVGRIDDAILLAFALHRLLEAVDPEVLEELWDGDEDVLELVTAFVAWGAEMVPSPLRRILAR